MIGHEVKMHLVHMLDCTYYGQMNLSYQRDGFGIQQTLNFNTYIGEWKNNRNEGIGLIFLNDGTIIYSYFLRDQMQGLAIVDNGTYLRCGIYRNKQIVGIGFQYTYGNKIWRMNRYHKGIPIETVKQQICDIENGIPKMVNVQQSLYFHLHNYLSRNYFPETKINVCEELEDGSCYYGLKNQKGYYGPALVYSQFMMVQAGFYEEGVMHGYGFKKSFDPFHYEFGCYNKGRKDGIFKQINQKKEIFSEYKKQSLIKNLMNVQHMILKEQKKYNFNSKDFFSAKNAIPFEQYIQLFQLSDTKSVGAQKQTTPVSPKRSEKQVKYKVKRLEYDKNQDYVVKEQKQKSSLQIIRQKMNRYYGIVSSSRGKRDLNQSNLAYSRSFNKNQEQSEDEDVIAAEQNPFN